MYNVTCKNALCIRLVIERTKEKPIKVSVEMDTGHALTEGATACAYSYLYQSLMGKGTMTVLAEYEEKLHALRRIMEHYSDKGEWSFQEKAVNMVSVMRLEVTALSCKEHSSIPAKHGGPA